MTETAHVGQDEEGYLWIISANGRLSYFNGVNPITYQMDSVRSVSQLINGSGVNSIYVNSLGHFILTANNLKECAGRFINGPREGKPFQPDPTFQRSATLPGGYTLFWEDRMTVELYDLAMQYVRTIDCRPYLKSPGSFVNLQ